MAQILFDDVLAQINQLPLSDQQKLYVVLSSKLIPSGSRAGDSRVPLIVENPDFSREMKWLGEHRAEYAGQWVALKGERLIARGASPKEVYAAADAAGVEMPLVTRVDDPTAPPFAGV
jgi:hypothetical protein